MPYQTRMPQQWRRYWLIIWYLDLECPWSYIQTKRDIFNLEYFKKAVACWVYKNLNPATSAVRRNGRAIQSSWNDIRPIETKICFCCFWQRQLSLRLWSRHRSKLWEKSCLVFGSASAFEEQEITSYVQNLRDTLLQTHELIRHRINISWSHNKKVIRRKLYFSRFHIETNYSSNIFVTHLMIHYKRYRIILMSLIIKNNAVEEKW